LLTKLNFSLENNQFTLFKQPIVSLPYGGGSTVFFEFLLRLKSDHHTFVMPDVFMRAAERYNMMPLLDRWVINHAFNYISKHFANHDLEKNKICFFINLSGASLSDSSFFKYTYDKMKDYSIDPRLICFEITETVAISDFRKTLDFINEVRSKGSYFALDDFGSGMSSFAYLKNLTVDFVKIDGSFVRDMTIDSLDYAIVESIHKVAHAVGLKTIAEFVENMETLNHLNKIGVNYAQGYAISYPSAIE
jgi:EAL domain-containing protein (putative c-di-GMP-specific phosphodiesterase class I)